ncbi:hypothetical protein O6H91_07G044300 [Diphasiastrum complanatum]|uniref:Uncharacterized protein n=1 Tax=Diphasiastrum complanatum TaxID=34168 RepID=A0ACC2D4J9_DIPCM|nr:hypothetical protein O6H91_07G044300 [Diphasiastrum complanatum]
MAAKQENGSEKSRDTSSHSSHTRSPLHPQLQQTRIANRTGSASPALEKKVPAEGMLTSTPGTPGRIRARAGSISSRATDQSEKSSVPRFGAWDANDPSSGDGFTVIFNKARDEKKSGGSARSSSLQPDSEEPLKKPSLNHRSSSKWCCFQSTSAEI